jgi:hypothetical protein
VRPFTRLLVLPIALVALVAIGMPSSADHAGRPTVGPIEALGESLSPQPFSTGGTSQINTDIAFWGNRAYQGKWGGFRIIDITNRAAPTEVLLYSDCLGGQGDVMIWEKILMRVKDNPSTGSTCDGDPVPATFEGIQIFDVSNEANPDLIRLLETPNGHHTATLVPDLANNRLLVYGSPSQGNGLEISQIPLGNPAAASFIRAEPALGSCHDTQVFLCDVMRTICAGGSGITVWSMDAEDGGSLTNPAEMYSQPGRGVSLAHSAAFTWDGERFVIGHESGGGTGPQCDQGDRELERTLFLYDTETGAHLGQWAIGQQTPIENCVTHNFNFIPTLNGRDILVGGHYQAGTWVVDFTDGMHPATVAYSDPPPENPLADSDGGAWSTYWYDGYLYETHITRGLYVFRLNTAEAAPSNVRPEAFSNPQTQMESIRLPKCRGEEADLAGTGGNDRINGTSMADIIVGRGGHDRINGRGDNDVVCAGGGSDKVRGSKGNDRLSGQGGSDSLNGGPGLRPGLPGEDACNGGAGRDRAKACEAERNI